MKNMNSLIPKQNQTKAIHNTLLKINDIEIISNIARGRKEATSLWPVCLINQISFSLYARGSQISSQFNSTCREKCRLLLMLIHLSGREKKNNHCEHTEARYSSTDKKSGGNLRHKESWNKIESVSEQNNL